MVRIKYGLKKWTSLKMNVLFFVTFIFLSFFPEAKAVSSLPDHSLNQKRLISSDSLLDYSFFVSGHFHGSSKNTTGLPAKTVTSNLNRINTANVLFLVSLGDLFLDIKNDIPAYRKNLIDKLVMPLYNVPGNHDKSGNIYENTFGSTFYYFKYQTELFIFLDTELMDGSITGAQWSMFKNALESSEGCKNIFVFSHRLIWAEEHPEMNHLFKDNTRSKNGNNFQSDVLPLLRKMGKNKQIYLMGGSLGNAPSPFFFHFENNITYIATSIRDTPKDAFLKVSMIDGKVKLEAFPLIMPIEFYDLDYYNGKHEKQPGFNMRLVPLYIKNMILHRYFWYGIGGMVIPFMVVYFIRRKRKK